MIEETVGKKETRKREEFKLRRKPRDQEDNRDTTRNAIVGVDLTVRTRVDHAWARELVNDVDMINHGMTITTKDQGMISMIGILMTRHGIDIETKGQKRESHPKAGITNMDHCSKNRDLNGVNQRIRGKEEVGMLVQHLKGVQNTGMSNERSLD